MAQERHLNKPDQVKDIDMKEANHHWYRRIPPKNSSKAHYSSAVT